MKKTKKITPELIEKIAAKNKCTSLQKSVVIELLRDPKRTGKDIAISAGYAEGFSSDHGMDIVRNETVQKTLAEILKGSDYDLKIQSFYDEVLALPTDLTTIPHKQTAIKELHKVRGDHAPIKQQKATVTVHVDGVKKKRGDLPSDN